MWHSPWAFLLLLLIPPVLWLRSKGRRSASLKYSSISVLQVCPVTWRQRFRPLLLIARVLCIALLTVALARPRKGIKIEQVSTEGVAIMLAVDRSSSMDQKLMYRGQPLSRLEAVKRVVGDFISGDSGEYNGRAGDMIGLVTYARYADTQCPLIRNNTMIVDFLKETQIVRQRTEQGTAIGDGIAVAAARLKKAESQILADQTQRTSGGETNSPDFTIKSKVIVLLTDGANNSGQYDPIEAAKMAAEWGIKIYTIGIGSGNERGGIFAMAGTPPDENLMRRIADITGGFYARADNAEALDQICKKIDTLEKTEVKSIEYVDYAEQFSPWAIGAMGILLLEMLLSSTVFRKIP